MTDNSWYPVSVPDLPEVHENPVRVVTMRASYPSSSSAWTVEFVVDTWPPQRTPVSTIVVAYCLAAPDYPLNSVIVSADLMKVEGTSQTGAAMCPAGSVLTGGGFKVLGGDPYAIPVGVNFNQDLTASEPIGAGGPATGWRVSTTSLRRDLEMLTQSYAVCAQQGLEAMPIENVLKDYTGGRRCRSFRAERTVCRWWHRNGRRVFDWRRLRNLAHVFHTMSVDHFHGWSARYFGGYQTPKYETRPCLKESGCLTGNVTAACFRPPHLKFLSVSIIQPAANTHINPESTLNAQSAPVTLQAMVTDREGDHRLDALVTWYLVSPSGEATEVGQGAAIARRLPAGQVLESYKLRAIASVDGLAAFGVVDLTAGNYRRLSAGPVAQRDRVAANVSRGMRIT